MAHGAIESYIGLAMAGGEVEVSCSSKSPDVDEFIHGCCKELGV